MPEPRKREIISVSPIRQARMDALFNYIARRPNGITLDDNALIALKMAGFSKSEVLSLADDLALAGCVVVSPDGHFVTICATPSTPDAE